jgi:hypothetical protein
MSTRVTQFPLAPLGMSFLSLYFVCLCLSNIMLNPLNTQCEYKPFTYISVLFEMHCTRFDVSILYCTPTQPMSRGQYVDCDRVLSNSVITSSKGSNKLCCCKKCRSKGGECYKGRKCIARENSDLQAYYLVVTL